MNRDTFILPCGVLPCETPTAAPGLRVVHEHTVSPVVYCGCVVGAGTRHEEPADSGMAHFVEHLSFKGTRRRRPSAVNNCLERVGGDLNAFTGKQETVFHAAVLRPDFGRAVDLLTDIVFASTYPQREITREVEVICDEIESYRDSPAELIFDEFESMVFGGHPLGRDILGSEERLRAYTTADALRFTRRHYRPENCVFFVVGDVSARDIARQLERSLARALDTAAAPPPAAEPEPPLPPYSPQQRRVERHTHQAHVLIGAPTGGGCSEERPALLLLNNLLGGPAMNSRLNTALRERAGLVYSADSYLTAYPDTGLWSVYFGCDQADVARCRRIVARELHRLIDAPLGPRALEAAKKQLAGQIGIGREARESYALALGKTYSRYGRLYDPDRIVEAIHGVTADELQQTAARLLDPARLSTLVYC